MKEKLRRSKRHMAGAPGTLLTERGREEAREGAHSKSAAGEGASASQSVVPSSPDASKPGPSSPARSSASGSPEPNCAICLGKLENKSFTDSCFHMFCFVCLLEWSKVKPECPLCKQKFKSIIHNVRSYDDYQQYHLDRQPESRRLSWEDPDGPRFRYRTTMTVGPFRGVLDLIHTYPNPSFTIGSGPTPSRDYRIPEANISRPSWLYDSRRESSTGTQERPLALTTSQTARQGWRNRRCNATSDFRKRVYSGHLRLVRVQNDLNRHSTATPEFYESNPAATHRLIPWLNRELNALLTAENHGQFVLELIMGLINRYHIQSEEFYQHLQPFLARNTRRFMEEFYSFAHSPYNLTTYDMKAVYEPALEEISDSDSSVEQEDIIVVDSSSSDDDDLVARAPTRWPAMEDLTGSTDRTASSMLGQSSWDSPTPGPSWDSSPERQGASQPQVCNPTFTTSISTVPNLSWSVGTSSMSSTGVKSESLIAQTSDSDSDSSTSGLEADDDVVVVGMEKPWQERSPIVLSSEDERPVPPERESKELVPIKLRIKKSRNRRERDAERSHQGQGHSSDRHAQWRLQSRSQSRSPAYSSSRCWQDDHWSRSRTSNHHREAHHSRSAHSRETSSQRAHSRSRSRESRSRDHRHLQSHYSSPRSSRKRHRTHSSDAGSRGNSVEVNSGKRKKSKHKKHKKHKKHGKHKHKKKVDKHSDRGRSRHRSRNSSKAEAPVAPEASSSTLPSQPTANSSAACKKHPSGHKANSDSSDSTGFSGAALEVAMEVAVGFTSQNESSLDGNGEVPAEVIAISSDEEDDIVEVVADVEQQPSLAERSPPMLFCPEELAKRATRNGSWNTSVSTELDSVRSSLFSFLKQPDPSTPLTRADPLLSSGATLTDTLLSPVASSPPPLSGPFCSEASSAGGRSVWGPFSDSVDEPVSTTSSAHPSTLASQDRRYGYIDERTFPSRSSLQSGGPVENGSAAWNGSKPDSTCVVSSGTASVLLPKWTSGMSCIAPRATSTVSSAAWRAAMTSSVSSTTAQPASSQTSSSGQAQGGADNLASAASCSTRQEPSTLAGSKDEQGTPEPSAYLDMLEKHVHDQNEEKSENATSEDDSSCESQEDYFVDVVNIRSTPRSPELISSDDDDEDCWVTIEDPRPEPNEPEEEIDVCKMSGDEAIENNARCFSEDDNQGLSNQAVDRSGQAREEVRVDRAGHSNHTEEDENQVRCEGQLMESMAEDLHSLLPDDLADEREKSEANVCPDGDDSESEDIDTGDFSDSGEHDSTAVEVGGVGVGGTQSFQDHLDMEEKDAAFASEASNMGSTMNSLVEPPVLLSTEGEEDASARNALLDDDVDVDADDSEDEGGLDLADEQSGWQASPAGARADQHKDQCDCSDEDSC